MTQDVTTLGDAKLALEVVSAFLGGYDSAVQLVKDRMRVETTPAEILRHLESKRP